MEQYLKIGAVTSPHGVRGEVRVFPTTDDPRRFEDLDEVILRRGAVREVHEIRKVKYSRNMVILQLSGISTMDEAEKYRQWEIEIPREKGVALEENEYYTADLLGMQVFTSDGEFFGVLQDVLQTGANDVYAVRTEAHGEVLIPAIKACIMDVNVEEGKMTVELLPGLVD